MSKIIIDNLCKINIKRADFIKKGLSGQKYDDVLRKKSSYKLDEILEISEKFQLSLDYLLTGKQDYTNLCENKRKLLEYYDYVTDFNKGIIFSKAETLAELAEEKTKSLLKPKNKINDYHIPVTETEQETLELDFLDFPASAGNGVNANDVISNKVFVQCNAISKKADYLIEVSGDSMESKFINGDIVFIKTQSDIDIGEIGLFVLNGDYFIKKKTKDGYAPLNTKYPDIKIKEEDNYYFCGKVLGKAEILNKR